MNPRYAEYTAYLKLHIDGVCRAWTEILCPAIAANFTTPEKLEIDFDKIRNTMIYHDRSKWFDNEFEPYCNYFYLTEEFPSDESEFSKAWLAHIHRNPHHWQYWIVINNVNDITAQDMPFEYICEMLCDWHSFTLRDPKSTALNWWETHKSEMILSPNTRTTIERLIKYMDKPLKQY